MPFVSFRAACALAVALHAAPAAAQPAPVRDEFFWLVQINKATAVFNTDEGLLDNSLGARLAAGIAKVAHDGNQRAPGARRS